MSNIENEEKTIKRCPFCGETIKKEAIYCRFCGKMINDKKEYYVCSKCLKVVKDIDGVCPYCFEPRRGDQIGFSYEEYLLKQTKDLKQQISSVETKQQYEQELYYRNMDEMRKTQNANNSNGVMGCLKFGCGCLITIIILFAIAIVIVGILGFNLIDALVHIIEVIFGSYSP